MRTRTWIRALGGMAVAGLALAALLPLACGQARAPETALVQIPAGQSPIRLAHASVDTFVQGSLARTVIELQLLNPNARVLEGELQFPLRDGQAVEGFALDMADGSMMPAVPVPKARGRQVFEEITRRGVDPALLEQTAGNHFRLRVYPLRPGASRSVRIELVEWLRADERQRLGLGLPLDFGATPVESLDVHVRLQDIDANSLQREDGLEDAAIVPTDGGVDLSLHRTQPGLVAAAAEHRRPRLGWSAPAGDRVVTGRFDGQGWFHAEVPVPDSPVLRPAPEELVVIWDASGSGAQRDHERELALLDALFKWQPDLHVRLRVVRDAAEPERRFDVEHGDWHALRAALQAMVYDGASNASLWTVPPGAAPARSLALLFSDGLGNWGPATGGDVGSVPACAVLSGPGAAASALRRWAEQRGGALVDLGSQDTESALRRLRTRGTRLLRVEGTGFEQAVSSSLRPEGGRLLVAGRFTAAAANLALVLEDGTGRSFRHELTLKAPPLDAAGQGEFVARRWAGLRIADLQAQAALHHTEIESLGTRFGLVTPETSLIVLETLSDFQRYDLRPPAGPLRTAFDAAARERTAAKAVQAGRHLADLARRFGELQAWWDKDFPKDTAPKAVDKPMGDLAAPSRADSQALNRMSPVAVPAPAPAPAAAMAERSAAAAERAAAGDRRRELANSASPAAAQSLAMAKKAAEPSTEIRIAVQGWTPDNAAARRLSAASDADRYAVYLDQRLAAAGAPAFYLDAAQVFATHKQRELALRVLSNLAELHIEDRTLLRVLAYRLQELGETAEAIRQLQRVSELAPDEPQSWRDLGLAQASAGAWQPAIDALWHAASGDWDPRFGDIDIIALGELDALAAQHPGVDLDAVDVRLRRNLPLDVRVALAWDTDNTDIDLWVKDPHGEWTSYQQPLSRQGGRVSRDVTNGYGPEVFSLRKAVPGHYEVHAKYYGSHRQVLGDGTTVMMRLSTGFGTAAEKHRDVILRLESARDDVLVGSFEVGTGGR